MDTVSFFRELSPQDEDAITARHFERALDLIRERSTFSVIEILGPEDFAAVEHVLLLVGSLTSLVKMCAAKPVDPTTPVMQRLDQLGSCASFVLAGRDALRAQQN